MSALLFRLSCCAVLLAPAAASAVGFLDLLLGKRDIQVITNTDVTPAGQKVPAATKTAPQYYIAASAGFRDFGGAMGGITEPPAQEVLKVIAAELAKQGYLPATQRSPEPTLLLFFTWGTLNVDYEFNMNPDLPARPVNRQQILRFLGGKKAGIDDNLFDPLTAPPAGLTMMDFDARQLYDMSEEDFYVAVVAAYDLQSVKKNQRQLLWTTRMATVGRGYDFPEVVPAMLAIGSAHFGRETAKPVWMTASEKFKPDVQIGELQLVEYLQGEKLPVAEVKKVPGAKPEGPKAKAEKGTPPRR